MRKLIIITAIVAPLLFMGAQDKKKEINYKTEYCEGWEDGYCEGWKDVKGRYAICPIAPICPIAELDCNKGYRCGYNRGFKAGMRKAYRQ